MGWTGHTLIIVTGPLALVEQFKMAFREVWIYLQEEDRLAYERIGEDTLPVAVYLTQPRSKTKEELLEISEDMAPVNGVNLDKTLSPSPPFPSLSSLAARSLADHNPTILLHNLSKLPLDLMTLVLKQLPRYQLAEVRSRALNQLSRTLVDPSPLASASHPSASVEHISDNIFNIIQVCFVLLSGCNSRSKFV